jgi:hypothetical protein
MQTKNETEKEIRNEHLKTNQKNTETPMLCKHELDKRNCLHLASSV